jgi:hypothetical protein
LIELKKLISSQCSKDIKTRKMTSSWQINGYLSHMLALKYQLQQNC